MTRLTWGLGAPCVVACAFWALRPMHQQHRAAPALPPERPQAPAPGAPPLAGRPAFDRGAFAARIWNTPADPKAPDPSATSPVEQPKPLKIELIAIIDDGNGLLRAALYDVESDRLLIVAAGDRVRGHTVTDVGARAVELSDGRSARRLALRDDRS